MNVAGKILKITLATVGIILLLLLLLCGLLTIPSVQTSITQKVTDELKSRFGVDISVGYVGINFKGNVVMEDLYLPDCNKDTLAYIERLEAGFNPATVWSDSKLTLSKVDLDSFKIYVSSNADVYNFEYLIDAFSSTDTTEVDTTPSNFDMELSDISLKRGILKYDIIDSSYAQPGVFDYNHIHLSEVLISGYLKSIQTDNLRAEISQLSAFDDLTHVRINDLKILDFAMLSDGFSSEQISLQTPKSSLTLNDVAWKYPSILDNIDDAVHHGEYNVDIAPSTVVLSEIAPFAPILAQYSSPVSLCLAAKGKLPMVDVKMLQVDCEDASIHAVATMSDCYDYKNSFYNADILVSAENGDVLTLIDTSLTHNEIVMRLFPFATNLKANGNPTSLKFDLGANTPVTKLKSVGKLVYDSKSDVLNIAASLATDTANIAKLIGDTICLRAKLDVDAELRVSEAEGLVAHATGVVPYLAYDKITATSLKIKEAKYSSETATADISFDEPFGSAELSASYIPAEKNIYLLNGGVRDFSPYRLGVVDSTLSGLSVSLNVDGRTIMSSLNDVVGQVDIDSLVVRNGNKTLDVGKISVSSDDRDSHHQIQLRSRLLDASFMGIYDVTAMEASVVNILHPYLPTFFDHKIQEGIDTTKNSNAFDLRMEVKDVAPVCDFFDIPLSVTGMKMAFNISDSLRRMGASVNADSIVYNGIVAKDIDFSFKQKDKMYVGDVQTVVYAKEMKPIKFDLATELENDVALTTFVYDNFDEEQKIEGDIKALLTFPRDSITKEILLKTFFMPSDLLLRDLLIGFEPSVITTKQDGYTKIDHFGLTEDSRQILLIDGAVGKSVDDSLKVSFDSMSISSVISKLRMGFPFSGFITGDVMARGVMGDMPRFGTKNLRVDSLAIDSIWVGDVSLRCGWSPERKAVGTKITITRDTAVVATAGGIVSPRSDSLKLRFNVREFPLATAQIMIEDYLDKLTGTVSAKIDVAGKISEPEVKGYIYLDKVLARVKANNASYRVNDSILFTPTSMLIKEAKIVDDYGRVAKLECNVQHNNFKNPKYLATLTLNDFILLNNPKNKDEMVYGKLTADGKIRVAGDADGASIRGNVSTGESAVMTVVLPESSSSATQYSTIVFVSHEDTMEMKKKYDETKFNIDASVDLKVTDNTEMSVVLSRTSGDKCTLKGGGNIRVEYTTTSDEFKLYGDYIIEEGQLKMKISSLPQKTFAIEKGGSINVGGRLETLKFDLSALYTTRADLATLDETFSNDPTLTNTRQTVGARLGINGTMDKFNLSYDITLPNAGDDLNQRLQGIINTDDLKIKEFAYILGFGTFYPVSSSQSAGVGSSMLTSIVSSSISNGMNTLFGDVLGSSWTIGADMSSAQSDGSDMEMSLSLSRSFFNDRLVFSTDFGYQNNSNTNADDELTKNFDLEYKLNKSGTLRLKGYRHTNTEFYRSGTSTEGLGFVVTKEAYTFKDLLKRKKSK
ncbi:MAG: translocation/assembly module TamB domain-containing protein [Paludibacteraceae bacterium]|nr:translocation/assembly module TamB domain-containing protein [Paludibacteraceae bacterium]